MEAYSRFFWRKSEMAVCLYIFNSKLRFCVWNWQTIIWKLECIHEMDVCYTPYRLRTFRRRSGTPMPHLRTPDISNKCPSAQPSPTNRVQILWTDSTFKTKFRDSFGFFLRKQYHLLIGVLMVTLFDWVRIFLKIFGWSLLFHNKLPQRSALFHFLDDAPTDVSIAKVRIVKL